ncbi:hypothetical protein VQ02_08220 [Methylobacterium variabile]|jgi:uncharacterized protein|uniref:Radical SAM core domain-containing protein n=1 Tax=Methylobacterium variabile TaxID=298794 RepID=A0A0J6T392_9HYPH|nr:radical SAM protein [Methylobacterium variabile]KMO40252.1 hypothetical protein VQ02_08220 [Methylobacterium variabile]
MTRTTLQAVVKITKYCNLRCRYCYEYDHLHEKDRMSLDQIERMFRNLASYARLHHFDHLEFAWHGGEPFLVPLDYYKAIEEIQRSVLGDVAAWNTVQTNLTVLTEDYLDYLRSERFFAGIGVSFDLHGQDRVDTAGRLRDATVARNLDTVRAQGIRSGGICVLSRNTLAHVEDIYRYYDERQMPFRFLPFYLSANEAQPGRHAISTAELVDALKRVFRCWARSETATSVDPVAELVEYAAAHLHGLPPTRYDKRDDEYVLVVNTDGTVWGTAETYANAYCYGNIFREDAGTVLASAGRERAIAASAARMHRYCGTCPFFGACPGHYVGEATAIQQAMLAADGCPVRQVLDDVVDYLRAAGFGADRLIAEAS